MIGDHVDVNSKLRSPFDATQNCDLTLGKSQLPKIMQVAVFITHFILEKIHILKWSDYLVWVEVGRNTTGVWPERISASVTTRSVKVAQFLLCAGVLLDAVVLVVRIVEALNSYLVLTRNYRQYVFITSELGVEFRMNDREWNIMVT